MRYLGGKSRTRNQIAAYLNQIRQPGQAYWEPFVGAGWVLEKVRGTPNYASDANPYLIAMWQKLQEGWVPPSVVTEEMYQIAKEGILSPEITAFIGFGCSFGGKWFAGFIDKDERIQRTTRVYAEDAQSSLLKKSSRIKACFYMADFFTTCPPIPNCLIYCDPPYEDTTAYGAVPPFDSLKFWERCRLLESQGHTLIISEYQAPSDFSCVLEMVTKTDLHTVNGKDRRVEKLFRLGEWGLVQPRLI